MDFSIILPAELSLTAALILLGVSFVGSLLTAAISMGGGMLMISVLSLFFPPAALLPLHGAIQFGSNSGRVLVQRAHVRWPIFFWMSLGAVLGSILGVKFAAALPENLFQIILGLGVLFMTWFRLPKFHGQGARANFLAGTILAFLGMIVGVVGPMLLTYLRHLPSRQQIVGTQAAIVSVFSIARVVAFAAIGFAFWNYVPFISGMIAIGFLGTLVGSRLLNRLPEQVFRWVIKILITALALSLLYRAF